MRTRTGQSVRITWPILTISRNKRRNIPKSISEESLHMTCFLALFARTSRFPYFFICWPIIFEQSLVFSRSNKTRRLLALLFNHILGIFSVWLLIRQVDDDYVSWISRGPFVLPQLVQCLNHHRPWSPCGRGVCQTLCTWQSYRSPQALQVPMWAHWRSHSRLGFPELIS